MAAAPVTVEWSLLGLLRQRPMYGYEIHRRLSAPEGLGLVWRLKQSQVYALLGRLESRGYVTSTLEANPPRPPRKVFSLTAEGQAAFGEWLSHPVEHGREFRVTFLAKLYFAQREGPEAVRTLLDGQEAACAAWLARQRAQMEGLRERQPYEWLVRSFRAGQIQAMLAWIETCRAVLLGGPEDATTQTTQEVEQ